MPTPSKTLAAALRALPIIALPLSVALTPAAQASPKETDDRIQVLQHQLEELQGQIAELKKDQAEQKEATVKQISEIEDRTQATEKSVKSQVKVSLKDGRPTVATADGNFTFMVRTNLQADFGHYMQGGRASALPAAYGPDLASGTNFRRLQLGFQGTIFGDWQYNFNYDFGGSANETYGHVLYAFLQYDGFDPFHIRVGAYAAPTNFEDSTAAADLMFLERTAPTNLQRSLAGAEGRTGVSLIYTGDRIFGALSLTGGKVNTNGWYDEQQAVVGRLSGVVYKDADSSFMVGGNFSHIYQLNDAVPNNAADSRTTPGASMLHSIALSDYPDITIDSSGTKLVNTGNLSADSVTTYGFEAAGAWRSLYMQGGYVGYEVARAPTAYTEYTAYGVSDTKIVHPTDNSFSGWYVQGSWIVTGERKAYVKATGAYTKPQPAEPFSLSKGTWGALELTARYSNLNLNDNEMSDAAVVTGWNSSAVKTYTFYNTVRGGEQKILTLGANWYLNNAVRFLLNYEMADISRLQAPSTVSTAGTPSLPAIGAGQSFQALVFRAQMAY